MARPRRDPRPRPVFTGQQQVDRPRVVSPIAHAVAQRALADIVQIGWNPAVSDEAAAKEMWGKARRALAIIGGDEETIAA